MQELIDTAISEAGPGASLAKVFDEMRGYSRELEVPAYEIQEVWSGFIDELKADGYGGFTHQGGKLAGGGKRLHQVRIYWDPSEVIELQRVGGLSELESIQPPTRIPLDDGSPGPFEVEAELRERRQARAMEIIQRVTGLDDGLTVRFEDLYLKRIRPKEWGGDGKTMTRSGGTYNIQEDTMTLRAALQATDREWDEAAFHESWHRVQYLALSPKEAAVMDTNWARLKTSLAANHGAGGGIAYAETQAVAFQRYGAARLNGQDPIKAMLGGYQPGTTKLEKAANAIASAFDKVLDFVEKVHNAFSIGTFDSTRGIFERAYQGALKGDANFNFETPGSGMSRMLDSSLDAGWRRSTWDYERSGGVKPADLELAAVNIDTQIADLKSKALAGGC
jgi:hypothetical protein